MRKLITPLQGFTVLTGLIAFIMVFGFGGSLDLDCITIPQFIIREVLTLLYIALMYVIYKLLDNLKAHRCGNTEMAHK